MPKGDNANSKANLVPLMGKNRKLTREEAQEMNRRSVEAKRRKKAERKTMKEILDIIADIPLKKGHYLLPEEIMELADAQDINVTADVAAAIAIYQRAMQGDVQANIYIRDTRGQKPSDKVELDQSLTIENWAKNHKVKL